MYQIIASSSSKESILYDEYAIHLFCVREDIFSETFSLYFQRIQTQLSIKTFCPKKHIQRKQLRELFFMEIFKLQPCTKYLRKSYKIH